jgi:hypothetical protein
VITFDAVALGREDDGGLPAGAAQDVQHVEPVEFVLDDVVVPGQVGYHHVEPEAVADGLLHGGPVFGDPDGGIGQGLAEQRFDDLRQRGCDQDPRAVLHDLPSLESVACHGNGCPVAQTRGERRFTRTLGSRQPWRSG